MTVNNAILVSLNISKWDANCGDKQSSVEVAEANAVSDKRLCRVRKSLLPRNLHMKRLNDTESQARCFNYANTHAWMHDGPRILMKSNFDRYMRQMRTFKANFEAAAFELVAVYDDLKAQAQQVLGRLYREEDYPSKESLLRRFSFEITPQPLPASSTLLELGFESYEVEEMRSKLEDKMADVFAKANERVWEKMFDKLGKFSARLVDPDSYIKQASIDALCDTAEMLPRISVTEDPRLEAISVRTLNILDGVSDVALKSNPAARARVLADIEALRSHMQAMMKTMHTPAAALMRAA